MFGFEEKNKSQAAGGFGTWSRSQLFVGPNESAVAAVFFGGILVLKPWRVSPVLLATLCFYCVQEPRKKQHNVLLATLVVRYEAFP